MSAELFLCVSQEDISKPYRFRATNINVYSMEEAAYHCYHYWKQSYDEFTTPAFIEWTRDTLGLPYMASKISVLDQIENARDKLIAFLRLFDCFDEISLATLKSRFTEWEKRLEWEKLKERADYAVQNGMATKAVYYYKKALSAVENPELLNNMGVGLMSLSLFDEALTYLDRAVLLAPNNCQILLNAAEAAIFSHNFESALRRLAAAEDIDRRYGGHTADILALYGELNLETDNIRYSIDYFQRAIALNPEPRNIFRLTDVYVKLRQYDKAMETLNMSPQQDKAYLMRLAALHHEEDNVPAAIKTIEKALISHGDDPALWTRLAMYHRLDYDLTKASSAITKALTLERHNDDTLLEHARVKKAMGRTKEYQSVLHSILCRLKSRYRYGVKG